VSAPTKVPAAAEPRVSRPQLVFFHSSSSGRSRRVEGFLAQVLQRRANHETFRIYRVDAEANAEIVERFQVATIPTLVVVEDKRVRGQLPNPRGCRDIESFLTPWLH
jgi:thioredoxin-like negative regulator of GroEL